MGCPAAPTIAVEEPAAELSDFEKFQLELENDNPEVIAPDTVN